MAVISEVSGWTAKETGLLRCIVLMLVVGCGAGSSQESEERSLELSQKLIEGRRVSYGGTEESALQLTSGDQPMAEVDSVNGSVVWMQADTRFSAPIEVTHSLEETATSLLSDQGANWGIVPEEFSLSASRPIIVDGPYTHVNFERTWERRPVRDAYLALVFVDKGEELGGAKVVREVVARHAGAITVANSQSSCGVDGYFDNFRGQEAGEILSSRELIVPVPSANGAIAYRLAAEVRGKLSGFEGEVITLTFECGTGVLLEAHSDRSYATVSRRLMASVYDRTYLSAKASIPLTGANIIEGATTFVTDGLGFFDDTVNAATGQIRLDSTRGYVVDQNVQQTLPVSTYDAENTALLVPTGNSLVATNAFTGVQRVNAFARRHLTAAQAPILGARVRISINVAGSCNAFYTNNTVNFYPEGAGCANTALINDVIYHEWGHGLDDSTGRQVGITDGAFSEGIGDIIAAYMVGDSNMAPGFTLNSPTPIRRLFNTLSYPTNVGEVHQEGLNIGGAFWDLRVALIQRYGATKGAWLAENYFFRHLLTTDAYLDSYQAVVRLDDDDGNAATRSPNFCLITAAFAAHGLATAVANCTDAAVVPVLPIDSDIGVALARTDNSGLTAMASSSGAQKLGICVGAAKACVADPTKIKAMKLDGTKDNRILFTSIGYVAVAPGDTMTVFVLDSDGKPTMHKSVQVMSR